MSTRLREYPYTHRCQYPFFYLLYSFRPFISPFLGRCKPFMLLIRRTVPLLFYILCEMFGN